MFYLNDRPWEMYVVAFLGGDWNCFSSSNSSAIRLVREIILSDTSEENRDVLKKSILFCEMIVEGHYQRQPSEN